MLNEQIDALESIKRRRLPFSERMGLLGMLVELSGDQLPLLAQITDTEKAAELQVEDVLSAALHAALQYGADCVSRAGGLSAASSNKLQQDSEQEALMLMKLLDTLLSSLISEEPHARRAVLKHVKEAVAWLSAVGRSTARSPTARQAALSVLSNLLEADAALLSPPPPLPSDSAVDGTVDGDDSSSASSTPQLAAAERAALLSLLLELSFELCSTEDELSVEVGHFSAQNMGTALLDCLCSSVTPSSAVATQVVSRASALLNGGAGAVGGPQSALLCLAVLPSTAPSFCSAHLSELVALIAPHLTSPADAVRAAAFVCIGELLEHVLLAREAHGDEWLTTVLAALADPQQPLPVKHKICLPLIQLATTQEADGGHGEGEEEEEEAEEEDNARVQPSAPSSEQLERISTAVLALLEQQQAQAHSGATVDSKPRWQFIALLAAAMEAARRWPTPRTPCTTAASPAAAIASLTTALWAVCASMSASVPAHSGLRVVLGVLRLPPAAAVCPGASVVGSLRGHGGRVAREGEDRSGRGRGRALQRPQSGAERPPGRSRRSAEEGRGGPGLHSESGQSAARTARQHRSRRIRPPWTCLTLAHVRLSLAQAVLECWSRLLPVLGDDVIGQLDALLPTISRPLAADYALSEARVGRRGRARGGQRDGDDEDEEEGEDDEEDADEDEEEEDADIEAERVAALQLYGRLIVHLGDGLLPFHEAVWSAVAGNVGEYSAAAQEAVATLVAQLPALFAPADAAAADECAADSGGARGCCGATAAEDSAIKTFAPSFIAGQTVPPPAAAVSALRSARSVLYSLMLLSTDDSVVARAFDAFAALVNAYGQWVVVESPAAAAAFLKRVRNVLKEEAICQQGFQQALPAELRERVEEDGHGEDGEDDAEHQEGEEDVAPEEAAEEGQLADEGNEDEQAADGEGDGDFLLQHALDCLVVVAKARGALFDATFTALYPYLLRAAPRSSTGYVFGCFADLTAPLAFSARPPWVDTVVPRLLSVLEKQTEARHFESLRNVAYATGCILFAGQAALSSYSGRAAKALAAVIALCKQRTAEASANGGDDAELRERLRDVCGCSDNAASALAKLLLVDSDALADDLPSLVPALLSALPVREDAAELPTVHSALVKVSRRLHSRAQRSALCHRRFPLSLCADGPSLPLCCGGAAAALCRCARRPSPRRWRRRSPPSCAPCALCSRCRCRRTRRPRAPPPPPPPPPPPRALLCRHRSHCPVACARSWPKRPLRWWSGAMRRRGTPGSTGGTVTTAARSPRNCPARPETPTQPSPQTLRAASPSDRQSAAQGQSASQEAEAKAVALAQSLCT